MVTIENVEVVFEVEGEDSERFLQHFRPAVERWYREVKSREQAEEQGRQERALVPPPRR
ncbi:hypothetical protein [Pyxidicoccus xibeiensis]|uniref:hypothetical protein n=1 Tax=Pyxidicoccus xibeiensis TaxID=2906759 RepID=UPI0020A6E4F3|nr:hypothetical protein [Pyxidicoccus xibeiensis]MCP3143395.1 hypothetical protein [Pyxidicoccus xibeiensis]